MARPTYEYASESGSIEVTKTQKDYNVIFTPRHESIQQSRGVKKGFKRIIARVNLEKTRFTFFPFKGRGLYAMEPKYSTLEAISIDMESYNPDGFDALEAEDIFASLPSVFIENYNFGLGFLKKYNQIASIIEKLGARHLYVSRYESTSYDKELESMTINEKDLNSIQKAIDKVAARATKILLLTKRDIVAESILEFIGQNRDKASGLNETDVNQRLPKNILRPFSELGRQRQNEAVEIITANGKRILQEQPSKLFKLRADIDLVTLDELIRKFDEMICQGLDEYVWQKLFEANPFILNLAFGVPVIKIHGNAYVGGRKIARGGDKIADFLVKNSISNNAAIVEIKKPGTRLLGATTYRPDVYAASSDLAGAINQLLDQIYKFQKNIAILKDESGVYDIETYSVTGVLVAGRSMSTAHERKSFELFRGNSKNITILTFDELLERLKQLRLFLSADDNFFRKEDLPF